ncbi:MAG: Dabb family protein [Acidimicrobiales bacterium]
MVRHVFVWRVAGGSDPDEVIEILNTLPARLPMIKGWEIGRHQGDPGDSGDPWDGSLITDFDSWESLEQYSTDPYHLQVVERLMPMFAGRAVVDHEILSER